jgi:hypothetical protein
VSLSFYPQKQLSSTGKAWHGKESLKRAGGRGWWEKKRKDHDDAFDQSIFLADPQISRHLKGFLMSQK